MTVTIHTEIVTQPIEIRTEIISEPIEIHTDISLQGGQNNLVGGYPVEILGAMNHDVMSFLDEKWVNRPQVDLVDGGNF